MYDSFIDQLSGLDLSGFSIRPAPFNETDFPCEDAIEQTLGAVWSDLFAMFSDTALEADAEDIAWGCVFLGSDESSFMTGAELVIDGGMTAQ